MITTRGLTVVRGGDTIVDGVDLQVGTGEWVGLIGPNGAGKTTILQAIADPTDVSGDIEVSGRPLSPDARARARSVALVPQQPVIPHDMRVIDYVLLGRTPHQGYLAVDGPEDLRAVETAMRSLDIDGFSGRPLGTLSGGELQRVVLARALAQTTPVLLLDEPTSALDVGHQIHVLGLIDEMRRECGLTVLAAVHDLTLAAQFCDRLLLISAGVVVAEGEPREVLTERLIGAHYRTRVRVVEDGFGGMAVIPVRDSRERDSAERSAPATMTEFA